MSPARAHAAISFARSALRRPTRHPDIIRLEFTELTKLQNRRWCQSEWVFKKGGLRKCKCRPKPAVVCRGPCGGGCCWWSSAIGAAEWLSRV